MKSQVFLEAVFGRLINISSADAAISVARHLAQRCANMNKNERGKKT
jgi:hypothetical protein